jgi:hypothetical protein
MDQAIPLWVTSLSPTQGDTQGDERLAHVPVAATSVTDSDIETLRMVTLR